MQNGDFSDYTNKDRSKHSKKWYDQYSTSTTFKNSLIKRLAAQCSASLYRI